MSERTLALTEFLLARIAEDEAEIGAPFGSDDKAGPNGIGWAEVGAINEVLMCGHRRAQAECEAKRRIVELHGPHGADASRLPCRELASIAAVYADHPDYDESWRP